MKIASYLGSHDYSMFSVNSDFGGMPSKLEVALASHTVLLVAATVEFSNVYCLQRYRMAGNFGGEFILVGNLFWRIGGFESNPPKFHPPNTFKV